jgi:anti-sigma regulatory factor (Ser/Thr protein kinase)
MEYLARMQRFTDILFNTKLPKEICDDIRLTIEEVGRNAIEWGNKFDREKDFKISYCIFSESIVFKFEDEGEGFIPQDLRNPTLDPKAHIKKRKEEGKRPGGFGVYLIQKLMDDVVYNDRGNVVVMTKYFNKGEK